MSRRSVNTWNSVPLVQLLFCIGNVCIPFLDGIMVVATEGDGRYLAGSWIHRISFHFFKRTQQLVSLAFTA